MTEATTIPDPELPVPAFPLPDRNWAPLAPLWEAAAAGHFSLPRCTGCGRFDWYPTGTCKECGSEAIAWEKLSGRARLFSWAVVKRVLYAPLAPLGPYISAIVTIEEDPNTRFVTRLVDIESEALRLDLELEVCFLDAGYPALTTGFTVPLFAPRQ
jgi:uncharacterized OB-fold protein